MTLESGQSHNAQPVMDALFDFVLRCPPQPKPEGNIVVYRAPGQKRVLLKQETNSRGDARDGLPSNQNTSTVGTGQPRNQAENRCFPAPARSHD